MTVILAVLWVLGLVSGAALGGWLHLLLALAAATGVLAFVASTRPQGVR